MQTLHIFSHWQIQMKEPRLGLETEPEQLSDEQKRIVEQVGSTIDNVGHIYIHPRFRSAGKLLKQYFDDCIFHVHHLLIPELPNYPTQEEIDGARGQIRFALKDIDNNTRVQNPESSVLVCTTRKVTILFLFDRSYPTEVMTPERYATLLKEQSLCNPIVTMEAPLFTNEEYASFPFPEQLSVRPSKER